MLVFTLVAALMVAVALTFVVVPLLRASDRGDVATQDSNIAILRQQREEIVSDHAAGLLSDQERDLAVAELLNRGASDLSNEGVVAMPGAGSRPWPAVATAAVLVPVLASALYWQLGTPAALQGPPASAAQGPGFTQDQIVVMVDTLAARMKQRPDDPEGWMLLARSQHALGRYAEAVTAFERANALVPGNAQLLADYADAVAMTQQGSLDGRPSELAAQALAIDPDHRKALAIAGTAELNRRNYAAAVQHWTRLRRLVAPDSEDARQVDSALAEARAAMQGAKAQVTAPGQSVAGKVTLAPTLAKTVAPTDTVFVFARAVDGPRIPLAVLKLTVKDLPLNFELTDAMAMTPNLRLGDFPRVIVEARITRSGNPVAQPGDLQGLSQAVKPGTRDLSIVVNKVVR